MFVLLYGFCGIHTLSPHLFSSLLSFSEFPCPYILLICFAALAVFLIFTYTKMNSSFPSPTLGLRLICQCSFEDLIHILKMIISTLHFLHSTQLIHYHILFLTLQPLLFIFVNGLILMRPAHECGVIY